MLNQKQFGCLKFLSVYFNDTQVCKDETSKSSIKFYKILTVRLSWPVIEESISVVLINRTLLMMSLLKE